MQAAVSLDVVKKRQGKRYAASLSKIREGVKGAELGLPYAKAIDLILQGQKPKFDETIDAAFRLNVDPKQADQMVRGASTLPHGLGKSSIIVVFAKGEKAKEAQAAGADFVGADDLVEKINGGWMDFTSVVATPDMMGTVSKLGRVLGPRGLMPNPKVGTVTFDLAKTIPELKKGRVEFRVEKAGIIHAPVGKVSFGTQKLAENFKDLTDAIMRVKPSSAKSPYILSLYIKTSMGPSVRVDVNEFINVTAKD